MLIELIQLNHRSNIVNNLYRFDGVEEVLNVDL